MLVSGRAELSGLDTALLRATEKTTAPTAKRKKAAYIRIFCPRMSGTLVCIGLTGTTARVKEMLAQNGVRVVPESLLVMV